MADKKVLGFIGIGVMGHSMAGHLLEAGWEVHVYNRTKAKTDEIVAKGAIWEDSPAEIAKKCDVVFTMVGFPKDVEETYLGEKGLVANAKDGALLIDMTTSSPSLARKIYATGKKRGLGVTRRTRDGRRPRRARSDADDIRRRRRGGLQSRHALL
mgnify:CR=1 FL=1